MKKDAKRHVRKANICFILTKDGWIKLKNTHHILEDRGKKKIVLKFGEE